MAENQDESTRNPQRPQDAPDALDANSDNAAESTQGGRILACCPPLKTCPNLRERI